MVCLVTQTGGWQKSFESGNSVVRHSRAGDNKQTSLALWVTPGYDQYINVSQRCINPKSSIYFSFHIRTCPKTHTVLSSVFT